VALTCSISNKNIYCFQSSLAPAIIQYTCDTEGLCSSGEVIDTQAISPSGQPKQYCTPKNTALVDISVQFPLSNKETAKFVRNPSDHAK
jgi:hypothetical protein